MKRLFYILISDMRRLLIGAAVLLLIWVLCYVSNYLGYRRGYHRALTLQNGTFVGSLDAMEKLRSGDIRSGLERIEAICYSSATVVYGDFVFRKGWAGQFDGKSMLESLRRYRQTYRANGADWTPMERTLEGDLAKWK